MNQNLEIIESNNNLSLKDTINNNIVAEISLNEYISKEDAESFLNDIKKHINIKQANVMQEKMKKVDEMMQKCGYQLKELIYAEIRSIEILNTIKVENLD